MIQICGCGVWVKRILGQLQSVIFDGKEKQGFHGFPIDFPYKREDEYPEPSIWRTSRLHRGVCRFGRCLAAKIGNVNVSSERADSMIQ